MIVTVVAELPGADVRTNPPAETFEHSQIARRAEVAGSRRMTCLHDPRALEQRHVNANRLVVQRASRTPHRTLRVRRGGRGGGQLTNEHDDAVAGGV